MGSNWLGLLGTAVVAVLSSVVVAKAIDYVQTHRKTDAETEEIYSRVNSREAREARYRAWVIQQHCDLMEYRFDQALAVLDLVLVQVSNCPGVSVAEIRAEMNKLKYIDRIPNREPPPAYGSDGSFE